MKRRALLGFASGSTAALVSCLLAIGLQGIPGRAAAIRDPSRFGDLESTPSLLVPAADYETSRAAGPPFALFPPHVAANLRREQDTAPGQRTIRAADRDTGRAPRARPSIHVEGLLPHQNTYDQSENAKQDWPAMRDLALAFALTGNRAYLLAVERYLNAWLGTYRVSLDVIDETDLDRVIMAYDLVRDQLPEEVRAKMSSLMRSLATGYRDEHPARPPFNAVNNWQSHRVKRIALSAFSLNDPALTADAERAFRAQLDQNMRADGSTLDFEQRDALHYVVYDLEPLVTAALAAQLHGRHWYTLPNGNGASLETALRWLAPYARGERIHEEFARTTIQFDRTRAALGMQGFSGPWDPKGAAMLYQLAARIDPSWSALATQLGPPSNWLALCLPR
jgi:hypothetical protein